jgi:hypothetical protein
MKKKTTRKTTQPKAITDPVLAAFLSYIDGPQPDFDAIERDAALAGSILGQVDRLRAFQGDRDAPDIFRSITKSTLDEWRKYPENRRLLAGILAYDNSEVTGRSADLFDVLVRLVHRSRNVGACLMYSLMKGGGR